MDLEPHLANGGDVTDAVPEKNRPIASDRPHLEVEGLWSATSDGDRMERGVAGYLKTRNT